MGVLVIASVVQRNAAISQSQHVFIGTQMGTLLNQIATSIVPPSSQRRTCSNVNASEMKRGKLNPLPSLQEECNEAQQSQSFTVIASVVQRNAAISPSQHVFIGTQKSTLLRQIATSVVSPSSPLANGTGAMTSVFIMKQSVPPSCKLNTAT